MYQTSSKTLQAMRLMLVECATISMLGTQLSMCVVRTSVPDLMAALQVVLRVCGV